MFNNLQVKTNFYLTVLRKNKIIKKIKTHNKVVNVGLTEIARFLAGNPTNFRHIALGTGGSVSETATDTELETEVIRDTITTRSMEGVGQMKFQYFLDTETGNTNTFDEAGLFDSSSNGLMLARATFEGIEKTEDDAWIVDWTFTAEEGVS